VRRHELASSSFSSSLSLLLELLRLLLFLLRRARSCSCSCWYRCSFSPASEGDKREVGAMRCGEEGAVLSFFLNEV
jgi:hypothetical protein